MTSSQLAEFRPELWSIQEPDRIESPQLLVFREHLEHNLQTMLKLAGSVDRLRPHCKTHKMPAVIRRLLELGITRHKAATLAEAEMLAQVGVTDIFWAYNPVGPNIARVVRLLQQYPAISLCVTADAPAPLQQLSQAVSDAGVSVGVLLDVNPGRDRTGLPVGPAAKVLYQQINRLPGLVPAGFHLYDGHFLQADLQERIAAVQPEWAKVLQFRDEVVREGCPVPRIVCGGTPTFPVFAGFADPAIELSPGTCVFHDVSYHEKFPDLREFRPAAVVFTRVISRPTADRVTLDAGSKAIAADPPLGQRFYFPAIPTGEQVIHNEEHLVIRTPEAEQFQPGDWLIGIPRHVCPTSALYRSAVVVEAGRIVDEWPVIARDRKLTI
jgi:D-serine deaminase-like pyridoxal phosphate-dependent protein